MFPSQKAEENIMQTRVTLKFYFINTCTRKISKKIQMKLIKNKLILVIAS